ncbi:MAG: iron ABC transporter permease [Moraxellaceae bacterium]|nr:iron ABC transporter permease [Moraxellaceae bacterium]
MLWVLLLLIVFFSLSIGTINVSTNEVWQALTNYNDTEFNQIIIQTVRLPRVLAGVIVGAGMAIAGAMMQGVTRNPLASPGILGVNAGAAFAVIIALLLFKELPLITYALVASIGAGLSGIAVYFLSAMGASASTPMRLTLSGAIFTAFLTALYTAILIYDEEVLDQIRFWTAGSLSGREMDLFFNTAPYIVLGVIISLFLARHITTLSLGEDMAIGLGQNVNRIRKLTFLAVILTAGGATALAGPIGFVGLIVPHITRFFVGSDYRKILPTSVVLGALSVTIADMLSRNVISHQDLPVGIIMGIVGAPFFIYLARKVL